MCGALIMDMQRWLASKPMDRFVHRKGVKSKLDKSPWIENFPYGRLRQRHKKKSKSLIELTKADRHVLRIQAQSGGRKFKEWLSSKPIDKFLIIN